MIIKSDCLINNPLLSVVICSYNRKNTVTNTIDSIIAQRCNFSYEIIIGDDCSTDGVGEVLLDYQKRFPEIISLLFHKENIGLGANWANCVKLCRGRYLTGCDNDDFWHDPNKISLQVDFLEKNPEFGMVHTDYFELNRKTGIQTKKIIHNTGYKDKLIKEIFKGNFKCCNSSVMYRKSIIPKYVPLDDYIYYQFPLQDWYTWICIANYTKFHCLPVITTTVGKEMESITRPTDYEKVKERFKKEKFVYKYLCDRFPDDLLYNEQVYDQHVNWILLNVAYKNRDFKNARTFSFRLSIFEDRHYLKKIMARSYMSFQIYFLLKKLLDYFRKKFDTNLQ